MARQASDTELDAAASRASEEPGAARATGPYARFGKRALDVLLILLAAPAVGPLVGLLAIIARLDGGPAFFGQPRVGRGGRVFTCWKIRTMVPDAEARLEAHLDACPEARAEWERAQKLRHDPRVTGFGSLLRSTSLDELPQVWNILTGEMSLVGPRPFTPDQLHLYQGRSYFDLRPGLTGPWQVSERNDGSFAGRAVHDAQYARELTLGLDVAILLRTVRVVLQRTGR